MTDAERHLRRHRVRMMENRPAGRLAGGWTHGLRSTYVEGCRCDDCTDAEAAYCRARYWRRRGVAAAS